MDKAKYLMTHPLWSFWQFPRWWHQLDLRRALWLLSENLALWWAELRRQIER